MLSVDYPPGFANHSKPFNQAFHRSPPIFGSQNTEMSSSLADAKARLRVETTEAVLKECEARRFSGPRAQRFGRSSNTRKTHEQS